MANRIFPTIAPFIRAIFGQDDNDDFRVARVDYNGGLLAGPFGAYHDALVQVGVYTITATGGFAISLSAVPTGYLYIVKHFSLRVHNAATNLAWLIVNDGSADRIVAAAASLPNFAMLSYTSELILKAGWYLKGYFESTTTSGSVTLLGIGYQVRLT
jgi:hypothetical protein